MERCESGTWPWEPPWMWTDLMHSEITKMSSNLLMSGFLAVLQLQGLIVLVTKHLQAHLVA